MTGTSRVEMRAGDVPGVLLTPPGDDPAPLVVCWHGFAPPASGRALSDALPLSGLRAWRVYFDLPLFGGRFPDGGPGELGRRQTEDYVGELLWPVVRQAVDEAPELLSALEQRVGAWWNGRLGLVGHSAGGTAVLLALAEGAVPADAAVVAGVPKDARTPVETLERTAGVELPWTEEAERLGPRLDFVARAGEIASARDQPSALLLLHGDDDELVPAGDARELHRALSRAYGERGRGGRIALQVLEDVAHGTAGGGPGGGGGLGAAEAEAVAWLERWLTEP